ncbi:MAG: SDR family NAD(P)-dependent oxidoreductase [Leptospiraceae bacterium]|nr:SDR family NAD(P)-dependent oxidoreductase [Leptospiraceae bacterium]
MKVIKGRRALVTGASRGIGRAIALALAREGATVALLARSKETLETVRMEIEGQGGRALVYPVDATDSRSLRRTLDQVVTDLGGVDILINNAGVGTFKPLEQMNESESEAPVALPFAAAVVASHHLIRSMLSRGEGHIVNLTSPAGYFPFPFMVPYTAARFAITGLSYSLHEEYRKRGIGVTLLCPAQVDTGYFKSNDADMGWYPRLARAFPVLSPELVGRKTIQAIKKNRKELIFPFRLWFSVKFYTKFPGFTFGLLRLLGLLRPVNNPPS